MWFILRVQWPFFNLSHHMTCISLFSLILQTTTLQPTPSPPTGGDKWNPVDLWSFSLIYILMKPWHGGRGNLIIQTPLYFLYQNLCGKLIAKTLLLFPFQSGLCFTKGGGGEKGAKKHFTGYSSEWLRGEKKDILCKDKGRQWKNKENRTIM